MLQWFRTRASCIVAVAILSMAAVGGAAVVPHEDDCHDAPCAAVEHDASKHRIGSASANQDSRPLHCVVCHWVRAFRPRTEARIVSAPASEPGVSIHPEFVTISGRAPVAQPPLRSPPSSPSAA